MKCLVQARMGSNRLPGKVLLKSAGRPLLAHLIERLQKVQSLDDICVITSSLEQDQPIVDWAKDNDIRFFRGSENDVLDRYYKCAKEMGADEVVRITADCPIIDPAIVDYAIGLAKDNSGKFDLLTNRYPITFPDGMDVDVIPFPSLERAWKEATSSHQREHVIPFFWENGLNVINFESDVNYFYTHRLTLDYREDFEVINSVIEELYSRSRFFSKEDILSYLEDHPEVMAINSMYLPARAAP